MPAAVKVERRTWRIAAEPGAPKKATVARFNIVASAVWSAEMALRISKKTTFEILIKKQINGSLTPAVSRTGVRSTEGTNKRSLLVSA